MWVCVYIVRCGLKLSLSVLTGYACPFCGFNLQLPPVILRLMWQKCLVYEESSRWGYNLFWQQVILFKRMDCWAEEYKSAYLCSAWTTTKGQISDTLRMVTLCNCWQLLHNRKIHLLHIDRFTSVWKECVMKRIKLCVLFS